MAKLYTLLMANTLTLTYTNAFLPSCSGKWYGKNQEFIFHVHATFPRTKKQQGVKMGAGEAGHVIGKKLRRV